MVGPVHAISRELVKFADGNLTARIVLRPGDAFQKTAQQINSGLDGLELRIGNAKAIVGELAEATDYAEMAALTHKLKSGLDELITEPEKLRQNSGG